MPETETVTHQLLRHAEPVDPQEALSDALAQLLMCYRGKRKEKIIQEKIDVQCWVANGADLNKVELPRMSQDTMPSSDVIEFLLDLGFHPNRLLSCALQVYISTSAYTSEEEALPCPSSAVSALEKQKALVKLAFARGANLDEMTFGEINIDNTNIEILKILLEHGLDPQALIFYSLKKPDSLEVLQLAVQKGARIPLLLVFRTLGQENLNIKILKLILEKSSLKLNQNLTADLILDEMKNLGSKFEYYLHGKTKASFEMYCVGTILHMTASANNEVLLKYILKSELVTINALNAKGQTALFFARTPEIADLLISEGIDTNIIDTNNNMWLSNPSLDMITYAIDKGLLPDDYGKKMFRNHFIKGNFEHARKIFQAGIYPDINPIEYLTSAIEMGLANSVENNKHAALLHLMDKAGIPIPAKHQHLRYNVSDSFGEEEFAFTNGLMHRLAKHYIALAKHHFQKALSAECPLSSAIQSLIDQAFAENAHNRYQYFTQLKELCPNSLILKRIESKFDANFSVVGESLVLLDNDFAIEVLTINGLLPPPLPQDIHAYRGLTTSLAEDDIISWFKYGHRAFSRGEFQKFLGYYVNQAWNHINRMLEFGGTYISLDPTTAAKFAGGVEAILQGESVLIEILLPKSSPKICGSWKNEYELVPSSIKGTDIVAVYKLDILDMTESAGDKKFIVYEAFYNPYISQTNGTYKPGDEIQPNQAQITTYKGLGCKELATDNFGSSLYQNYDDFVSRYTPQYPEANALLETLYFSDRPMIENAPLAGCDPEVACC